MRPNAILISVLVLLTGCAELPLGPSVAVMPAPGKPFDLFVSEESICRHYAEQQVGISPQQTAQNSTATGAVAGTALGAAAGGAIGAAFGSPGPGAAVGAGTGLLTGSRGWCQRWLWSFVDHPAALRYCLPAMHVCQGQPDSRLPRCLRAATSPLSSFDTTTTLIVVCILFFLMAENVLFVFAEKLCGWHRQT